MHDLKGHIENFRRQLRALRFRHDVDYYGLSQGNPGAFLEFYRHLLCDHSTELTKLLVGKGFAILGTSDYRFMETVYRMLRDLLRLHPPLTLTQFYTNGFAEKKLEMACQIAAQFVSLIARSSANIRLTKQGNLRCGRGSRRTSGITYSIPSVLPEVSCIPVEMDGHQPINVGCGDDGRPHSPAESTQSSVRETTVALSQQSHPDQQPVEHHSNTSSSCQVWSKQYHNGFEVPAPRIDAHLGSKDIEPRNSPSMFSAFLPTVGQMNQSHRRPRSALMMNERYARYGKVYHLLNSNPRPGSHFTTPTVKLPAASQHRSSPYLVVNTSASATKPVPRISITPEKSSSSAETAKELHATRDVVQHILDSLTVLTGKVDTMLSRLDHLESRLSCPPHPSHYFEPRPSNHEPSHNTEPVKYGRTTEPDGRSTVHHSGAYNGEAQGPESTLAPPTEQFTMAASVPALVPSSTTVVESVLSSPKCHRPPGNTQSSSSLSTIEMPYQVTPTVPAGNPQNSQIPVVTPTCAAYSSSSLANRPISAGRLGLASTRTSSGDRLTQRRLERPSLLKTGHYTLSQSCRTQPSRQPIVSQPFSTSGDWHSGTTRNSPVGTNSPTGQAENGTIRSPSRAPAVREQNVGRPPPSTFRWNRSPRFYKPIMFRPMEPLDCGTNNSSLFEPVKNNHPSHNSESYLTQVDRISSMLTETQLLLKSHPPGVTSEVT